MPREVCEKCSQVINACICAYISPIKNEVSVLVIQHPSEVKQAKGSLTLLANSLITCQVIVTDDVDNSEEFHDYLKQYDGDVALLYPSENSELISQYSNTKISALILIDATWKKAYRLYVTSSILQSLQQVHLPEGIESLYKIRKTRKSSALSTLEAAAHGLSLLENNINYYDQLLKNFVRFNEFRLSFVPKAQTNNKEK